MLAIVTHLERFFAPWQSLYSDSKAVDTVVTSVHLVAMLFGGGYAVAADRAVLRARPTGPSDARRLLEEMHALHVPVVAALVVLSISGVAMAAADIATFIASPIFAAKLAVVVLLLGNGLLLLRAERALSRVAAGAPATDEATRLQHAALWRRLRLTAWASVSLWTAALVTGVMLTNAA